MKKFSVSAWFYGMLFVAGLNTSAMAQDVPQGVNYQAVARNASGQVIANQSLSIKITLFRESQPNAPIYQEIHQSINTNQFGLFNLVIGQGAVTGNGLQNFSQINWGASELSIKVEADLGNGFVDMGASRLWSVPYSLNCG